MFCSDLVDEELKFECLKCDCMIACVRFFVWISRKYDKIEKKIFKHYSQKEENVS